MLKFLYFPFFFAFLFVYCFQSLQWMFVGHSLKNSTTKPIVLISTTKIETSTKTATTISQCPNPPSFANAQVSSGQNQVGSQRIVNCNDGFTNKGLSYGTIRCQSNFKWSNPGECERICLDLPNLPNAIISSGSSDLGAEREIICKPGYTLVGSSSIICMKNGQWTEPFGRCIPQEQNGSLQCFTSLNVTIAGNLFL